MGNVFLLPVCNGLETGEATLADWLAAGGSPLAGATLVPMEGAKAPAREVTLTTGPYDLPVKPTWELNHGK